MRRLFTALLILFLAAAPALADVREAVNQLGKVKLDGLEDVIKALAAEPGEVPARALGALAEGNLYVHKADGLVVIAEEAGDTLKLIDPVTAEALGDAKKSDLTKIRINNSLRRVIRAAAGGSALTSPDAAKRLEAAQAVFKSRDAAALPALEEALTKETDPNVKAALELAKASALLASDAPDDVKSAAIATLAATGSRDVLPILAATAEGTGSAALDAQRAISDVERTLAYWSAAQNVWFGISLGSVLLLAAIGLAITFGVMGVIIERIMIRPLYGRPLETLLATWGESLILQQAIRMIIAPTNREVGNPSWASGAFEIGQISITYNRLWLVLFSFAVFAGLALLVPVLNLWVPPESPFHIPDYLVPLLGRYLCFAILALALDLAWGYCGILSLGHGAFFALGGYAMGMYLMRQIGTRGVYAHPELPDFMVFLNWKELPWYWYGFDMFWFACVMVMVVPGLLVLGALFVCVTLFLPKSIVGMLAVWAAKRPARKKARPVVTPAAEAAE